MSNTMQIEVVANPVAHIPTAKGGYNQLDLAYKNKSFQDKLEGKKIMDFANKDVFAKLSKAGFGDIFEVTREKTPDGKFWNWTAVASSNGAVSTGNANTQPAQTQQVKTGNVAPKSNYETAEERAARQVLIVRQSSISSAVDLAVANKVKDPQEVIKIAQAFEAYVFGTAVAQEVSPVAMDEPPANFFEDFENDLP